MTDAVLMDMRHCIIDYVYGTTDVDVLSDLIERIKIAVGKKKTKYSAQVSPSADEWFDDPENVKDLDEGIAQLESGQSSIMTMDEINSVLGL